MTTMNLTSEELTKIEGHAVLHLKVTDGKIEECRLRDVEGSRYFEGLVVGRRYDEAWWLTSRI